MSNIIMADASGISVEKKEFVVETEMTTTSAGGNTRNFINLYRGSAKGFYIFDISGNSTAGGYVRYAISDYRTGVDRSVFKRPNGEPTDQVATNYDCFLKAGAVITRWFIPEEAF